MSASTERKNRVLCALLAALLALGVLAGCGGGQAAEPSADPDFTTFRPVSSDPAAGRGGLSLSAEELSARALDDWLPGECLVAAIERDEQIILAYGLAEPAGEDRFTFVELFTDTPLFRFDGQDNGELPRYYRFGGVIDFEPLDPVMEDPVTLLEVDNFSVDGNYFYQDAGPYEHGIATLRDAGDRYFNLIPEKLRLVTVAPDAGIVWGETPYDLLYGEAPGVDQSLQMRRLSAEEEAAAIKALRVVDPDGLFYDSFESRAVYDFDGLQILPAYAACFYLDGRPKVVWGIVTPDAETESLVFSDFFSFEPLFSYSPYTVLSSGKEYLCSVPLFTFHGWESIDFTPLHPFFENQSIDMRLVDNWQSGINFYNEIRLPFDDDIMDFVFETVPEIDPDTGNEVRTSVPIECSRLDMARKYLNLVPRELWVTGDDLAAAEADG